MKRLIDWNAGGRLAIATLLVVGISTFTPARWGGTTTAAAQPRGPIPATLARRIAEAVDAWRTGEQIWLVIDTSFPHNVQAVFATQAAARTALRPGDRLDVFGPYRTPIDFGLSMEYVTGCVHTRSPNPSYYFPGGRGMCPSRAVPLDSIRSMRLVIQTIAGDSIVMPLPPRDVDAVFFSVSSFDKFLAPYYTRVYGPGYTKAMRDSLEAFVRRR